MKCEVCDTELKVAAKFCTGCGAAVELISPDPAAVTQVTSDRDLITVLPLKNEPDLETWETSTAQPPATPDLGMMPPEPVALEPLASAPVEDPISLTAMPAPLPEVLPVLSPVLSPVPSPAPSPVLSPAPSLAPAPAPAPAPVQSPVPSPAPVQMSVPTPALADGLFCTVCGKQNSKSAKFCRFDGTPLGPQSVQAPEASKAKHSKAASMAYVQKPKAADFAEYFRGEDARNSPVKKQTSLIGLSLALGFLLVLGGAGVFAWTKRAEVSTMWAGRPAWLGNSKIIEANTDRSTKKADEAATATPKQMTADPNRLFDETIKGKFVGVLADQNVELGYDAASGMLVNAKYSNSVTGKSCSAALKFAGRDPDRNVKFLQSAIDVQTACSSAPILNVTPALEDGAILRAKWIDPASGNVLMSGVLKAVAQQ